MLYASPYRRTKDVLQDWMFALRWIDNKNDLDELYFIEITTM